MAEHSVSYNGIIYIIPTDDLYRKYENSEAFIDKYGRLIDSKSKKVIKELEHKGDLRPVVQRKVVIVQPPEEHPVRDAAKQAVDDVLHEHICRAVYWTFDVGIPSLWHEYIVPFFHQTKETLTSRDFKLTLFANQFFLIYLYFQSTFVSRPYYTFTPIRMSFVSSGVSIGVKWRM